MCVSAPPDTPRWPPVALSSCSKSEPNSSSVPEPGPCVFRPHVRFLTNKRLTLGTRRLPPPNVDFLKRVSLRTAKAPKKGLDFSDGADQPTRTRIPSMAECTSQFCPARRIAGRLDSAEFAREIRQLAIDLHRSLTRPDLTIDQLTGLKLRFEDLLDQTHEPRATEVNRWLCSGHRLILAKLHSEPAHGLRVRPDRGGPPIRQSSLHVGSGGSGAG